MEVHGNAVRRDPQHPDAEVVAWSGWIVDVTDTTLRRQRSEALAACAEALTAAGTVEAVVDALTAFVAQTFAVTGVLVAVRQDPGLVVHQRGYEQLPELVIEPSSEAGSGWPLLRRVMHVAEPALLHGIDQLASVLGQSAASVKQLEAARANGELCWMMHPLVHGGETFGAIRLGWAESQALDDADRALLAASLIRRGRRSTEVGMNATARSHSTAPWLYC